MKLIRKNDIITLNRHEVAQAIGEYIQRKLAKKGTNVQLAQSQGSLLNNWQNHHKVELKWSRRDSGVQLDEAIVEVLSSDPVSEQVLVPSDRSMKEIKAALADANGKEHALTFSAKEVRGLLNIIVNQNLRIERFEKKGLLHPFTDSEILDWMLSRSARALKMTSREAVVNAMVDDLRDEQEGE